MALLSAHTLKFRFLIVVGTILWIGATSPTHAFVLLPPAPGQGLPLSIELPVEPFESLGRGTVSFNSLAEDAAASWNSVGVGLLPDHEFFTRTEPAPRDPCTGIDGINTVIFSSTSCGVEWGDVLGITIRRWFEGSSVFEADVLFNDTVQWDAYSGPIQVLPGRGQVEDFTRTALHEFGHALGLDHPDGQPGASIMTSNTTNVDSVQPDDQAGSHAIKYVPAALDFSLAFIPNHQIIAPGSTAEFVLTAITLPSDTTTINVFSLTGICPDESSCSFDSLSLTENAPITYTIETTANTPTGEYPQLIIGTASTVTRLVPATLIVGTEDADFARVVVLVEDNHGAPLPQVKVRVKHQVTKEKEKGSTDANGEYISPLLEPAEYKVICKLADFVKDKEVIMLAGGEDQTVTCVMEPAETLKG